MLIVWVLTATLYLPVEPVALTAHWRTEAECERKGQHAELAARMTRGWLEWQCEGEEVTLR